MGAISGCTAALRVKEWAAVTGAGVGWIGNATMALAVAAAIPAARYERIDTSITTPVFVPASAGKFCFPRPYVTTAWSDRWVMACDADRDPGRVDGTWSRTRVGDVRMNFALTVVNGEWP